MFTLNLVRTGDAESACQKTLVRTATPKMAAKRKETEFPAAVPEKNKRKAGWFASFEKMLAAYADLAIRGMRD